MATLREETRVNSLANRVWDAVRDIGALHTRLVPGFVTNTVLDGDTRIVTFGNGMVVCEPIVSIDDERRRLAWTATGGSRRTTMRCSKCSPMAKPVASYGRSISSRTTLLPRSRRCSARVSRL